MGDTLFSHIVTMVEPLPSLDSLHHSKMKLPSPRKFSAIPSTVSAEEIEYYPSGLIDTGNFGSVYFGKVRELPAAIKVLKDSKRLPKQWKHLNVKSILLK